MKDEKQTETIKTKQDIKWHFVSMLLDVFPTFGATEDEEFAALYRQMYDYVANKLDEDISGEITDTYVVVEHTKNKA